jgi:hypothetical protein
MMNNNSSKKGGIAPSLSSSSQTNKDPATSKKAPVPSQKQVSLKLLILNRV